MCMSTITLSITRTRHHTTHGDDQMAEHMLANAGTPNPGEAADPSNGGRGSYDSSSFAYGRGRTRRRRTYRPARKETIMSKKETVVLKHPVSGHRAVMHLNKGGLHRALGVPEGETIPADKLASARNSDNPHVAKMANLAHTMEGWHHGK